MKIVGRHAFRVTRDADVEIEVDEADDLLETLESLLRVRQRSPEAVRLEVDASMPQDLRTTLLRELGLKRSDLYVMEGLVDHGSLWSLTELTRPSRKGRPWHGVTPTLLAPAHGEPRDLFEVLRQRDVLVHHPYDRFATSVEALVDQAADDPDVLAVKQTIYMDLGRRRGADRAFVDARGSVRQGDRSAGGAHGAGRRGGEHRLGADSRESGSPRHVRGRRPQEPRQDRLGRAEGRGQHPAVLPHRHRQLQPANRHGVRRRRAALCHPDLTAMSPTSSTVSRASRTVPTTGRFSSTRGRFDPSCWTSSAARPRRRTGTSS